MPWRRSLHEVGRVLGPFMFLLIFYSVGASADDPIFSRFVEGITVNPLLIGILASICWITFTLTSEPAGSIVDRIGERKAILFGGGLDALGLFAIYFSNSVYVLVLALIINGFGSAVFWTAARTHIANLSHGSTGTAFGAYTASWGLGWSIGPLLGGTFALILGIKTPFLMGAIILAISVLMFRQIIPADKRHTRVGKSVNYELHGGFLRDGLHFLKNASSGIKKIFVLQMVMYAALYMILVFAPLYFVELNHAEVGAIFFINAIIFAVGSILWGPLADKFNKSLFVAVGSLISGGIVLFLLNSFDFISIFIIMGVLGLSLALIEPVLDAMLNDRIDRKTRGIANGLSQASFGFGAAIGPVIGGAAAASFGIPSSFVLATILFIVSGVIAFTIRK